jgi:hypothetical protein
MEAIMDNYDRLIIRQQQSWKALRRLGVKYARCPKCSETCPLCFMGDVLSLEKDGLTLVALCERCKRKDAAPTNPEAIERRWEALRTDGCRNTRCHCGEDNPFCMEADHIAGRKSSDLVRAVCINCHLKRTSRQMTEYSEDELDPEHPYVSARNLVRGTIEHLELMTEDLRLIESLLHNLAVETLSRK